MEMWNIRGATRESKRDNYEDYKDLLGKRLDWTGSN